MVCGNVNADAAFKQEQGQGAGIVQFWNGDDRSLLSNHYREFSESVAEGITAEFASTPAGMELRSDTKKREMRQTIEESWRRDIYTLNNLPFP